MVTYTFTNGTVADADEVNQNFTDAVNLSLQKKPLTNTGTISDYGFNSFQFRGGNNTNTFTYSDIWQNSVKTKQNSTYEFTTDNMDYNGVNFNNAVMSLDVTVFKTGDGTSDILDNFDDGTVPTFWTVTGTGTTNTETGGYWQVGIANQGATTVSCAATSNDFLGTSRTIIMPLRMYSQQASSTSDTATFQIGNATDGWTTIHSQTIANTVNRRDFRGVVKVSVSGTDIYWEIIGEEILESGASGALDGVSIIKDSGYIDATSYGSLELKYYSGNDGTTNDSYSAYMYFYGIYEHKASYTSTVTNQISNDGGTVYDTINSSGLISFTAADSDLKLKLSGTAAANECIWFNYGLLERID